MNELMNKFTHRCYKMFGRS